MKITLLIGSIKNNFFTFFRNLSFDFLLWHLLQKEQGKVAKQKGFFRSFKCSRYGGYKEDTEGNEAMDPVPYQPLGHLANPSGR